MNNVKKFLFATICFCLLAVPRPAQAEEIEVLRGEEEETEVFLEGTDEVYSLYGELKGTTDFVLLLKPEGENGWCYQAQEVDADGSSAKLLLSSLGENTGYGLRLLLKVQGVRIGTGTVTIVPAQLTDSRGNWLKEEKLPEITVKVLPNPLVVSLSGIQGNSGWYTSKVSVTITDKDAAEIWKNLGSGRETYTGAFEVHDGEWTLTVTSDDGYGYKKEEVRLISVDTVEPSLHVSEKSSDWQQETIKVTAESTDYGSGIDWAGWAFSESMESCGGWNPLNGEELLSMEQDGVWYLHLKAVDIAGNEKTAVYGPYQKDSVEPQICMENIGQSQLVEERILPEVTVMDECSGIKKVTYLLDGKEWSLSEITGKGKHTLTVMAEDFAGNTGMESVEFSIYDTVSVTASAGNSHYTGTASLSALVTYRGEPLPGAEAEFFVNGENIGSGQTDENGMVRIYLPVELSPQVAEITVMVPQDEQRFFLAAQDSSTFRVYPENAWLLYTGDYSVRNGEALHVHLETGEIPDRRMGDITRAELLVELYKIENDGSRTFVDEVLLTPDAWGRAEYDFCPDPGLYELKASFTEDSCYTGNEVVIHPGVYDIVAELEWEGGRLLLDLPHLGIYVEMNFTFLPVPSLDADIQVRIPGTGITLTENRITGYNLTTDGLVLTGTAVNPEDGCTYSYEIRSGYSMGVFLDELEVSVWKGEDRTEEPVYRFRWDAKEGVAEE